MEKKSRISLPRDERTFTLSFIVLLVWVSFDYLGLGKLIPGGQKLIIVLSLGLFLSVFVIGGGYEVLRHRQTKLYLFMLAHTAASMGWAMVTIYAFNVFKVQFGYVTLFICVYLILTSAKKIKYFMFTLVLVHLYIIIINLDKLFQTVRIGGFQAGYFLGDGNDLAWSLAIFLPFLIYFVVVGQAFAKRFLYLSAIIIFVVGIVGTGSRGAFLAIMAGILYLVFHSRQRLIMFVFVGLAVLMTLALAPGQYTDRVQSITEYEEDSSALGRITAWKAAGRMAVGHPLGVGAGNFNSAYGRFYRPEQIDDRMYAPERWISPHSIYFLVLGEYGIIGVATLLFLLYTNYTVNQRQVRAFNKTPPDDLEPDRSLHVLPKYLNMSFVAFCVGGIFLGGVHYPHLFILTALIMRTNQLNEGHLDDGERLTPVGKRSVRRRGTRQVKDAIS